MRLLHYLEIQNFKRFGDRQRIELDHPSVLIGPNNCGKTSAIQALALWSQAVRSWYDVRRESSAKERPSVPLNRLNIVSVPVQRTRFFWHNAKVQGAELSITAGVEVHGQVRPLTMRFTRPGDEVVYCSPDEAAMQDMELIEKAASIHVELLYPMSGLETEEPILQPGRIDVLLGQGRTAQVLRNLCLIVERSSPEDWIKITALMERLFQVKLGRPQETARGAIELQYNQAGVKDPLDVAMAGRGFQQMLLIFSYLFSHKGSVLLVDEPDAHLEILRQKQVYILLREIAAENGSQVVLVTHSEVILDEALEENLTLLLEGQADDLTKKAGIRDSLKHFGASHYVKARERGYVLYVEGRTDIDILRAFAERMGHPASEVWDERINTFYVQDNYPDASVDSELERVEGGFGVTPRDHFNGLRKILPSLRGLAILDNDGRGKSDFDDGSLKIRHWRRYEVENYFITPDLLRRYALSAFTGMELFDGFRPQVDQVLDDWVMEWVFEGDSLDFKAWKEAPSDAARVIWEAKTERRKMSKFAEDFFRRLADATDGQMILKKGEFHRMISHFDPLGVSPDVSRMLDGLNELFLTARNHEEVSF
jgi:ABC-type multidrug transport system ATPase subunit